MAEIYTAAPFTDHVDAYPDMVMRRGVNNFAAEPVDFYVVGLQKARQYVDITQHDRLLDIGCSSGRFIIEAAMATQTPGRLYGLDPDEGAYTTFLPPHLRSSGFAFMKGAGEHIPMQDSSVKITSAHNVLFRANNPVAMLTEARRVTEPNGLLLLSTNGRTHAFWRHLFERLVAVQVSQAAGMFINPLRAPADGSYIEDIPSLLQSASDQSGRLEIIDTATQDCPAIITRDQLDTYLFSLELSANRITNDPAVRRLWRQVVGEVVAPFIDKHIQRQEVLAERNGRTEKPYFADTVYRGLFVLRNIKF